MAEFCKCGSIIISGHCTNKNCVHKTEGKSAAAKTSAASEKGTKKPSKTRRASKCITYNLNDLQEKGDI